MRLPRLLALALTCLLATLALAGPARADLLNPLRAIPWGIFHSPTLDPTNDAPSAYFNQARSRVDKAALTRVLATPRFRWFGSWIALHDQGRGARLRWGAYRTARSYIASVQHGNPNALVGLAIFRLDPFEREASRRLPTAAEQASYRAWIIEFTRGIRDSGARVVVLLQPDLPLARKLPHHSKIDLDLIRWTAGILASIPRVTTYIDAGASDWARPDQMSAMLRRAGVQKVRGFGLNLTHYSSTAANVAYGKRIVADLARHRVRGKHFVVSTAMNGRPFTFQKARRAFREGTLCATRASRRCVTLGHPPTTHTGTRLADAFLWMSRPWYNNATIRSYPEMLRIIGTSPFF